MSLDLVLRGMVIGFSIAAPVGPIGILCIRRTLAQGRLAGLLSGLGAATADGLYGLVAAVGVTAVGDLLVGQQRWLRLVGGLFLCYLGARAFRTRPASEAPPVRGTGLLGAYASTLFLTLTNPVTIIAFAGVYAGLGLADRAGEWGSPVALVAGVFAGSALWWLVLSSGIGPLKGRFGPAAMAWVNRISGLVLVGFGVWALSTLLW